MENEKMHITLTPNGITGEDIINAASTTVVENKIEDVEVVNNEYMEVQGEVSGNDFENTITHNEPMLVPVLDENNTENPINEVSEKQLSELMKTMSNLINVLESQWNASKKEFDLTDSIMKTLITFNSNHLPPIPPDLEKENLNKWIENNKLTGLNELTDDDIKSIFGEDHKIYGITNELTLQRIKDICEDYTNYISAIHEYRKVHDSFMELLEYQEKLKFEELQEIVNKEEDPEKKIKLQKTLDEYYTTKYLDFLENPLEEIQISRLVKTFTNAQKIKYLIERGRSKLKSMKISSKFILEISQFEKRFLDEKYHHQNNIFLLFFLELLVYSSDVYDKKDLGRTKVMCIVIALDRIVRKSWPEDVRDRILNNMIKFEEQFINRLPKRAPEDEEYVSSIADEISDKL
jgi:hypothetical protein